MVNVYVILGIVLAGMLVFMYYALDFWKDLKEAKKSGRNIEEEWK